MNNKGLILAIGLLLVGAALPDTAIAANATDGGVVENVVSAVDDFQQSFKEITETWFDRIRPLAINLLYITAAISIALQMIYLMLRGADLQEIAQVLVRFCFVIGFFSWIILDAGRVSAYVLEGFASAASLAHGAEELNHTPGAIIQNGFILASKLYADISGISPRGVGTLFVIICLTIIYGLIAATILVTMIEAYVVTAAGTLFLGFAGFEETRHLATNYLRYLISIGAKLYVMLLVAGIGQAIINDWTDKLQQGETLGFLALLMVLIIQLITVQQVPASVQAMVNGHSSSANSMAIAAGGAATFAALTTALKVLGKEVAGFSKAAYQLSKLTAEQRESGSSSGGFAKQFAGNAMSAAKEKVGASMAGDKAPTMAQAAKGKRLGITPQMGTSSGASGSISKGGASE